MKRALFFVGLLALLCGFVSITTVPQASRVRWDTVSLGQTAQRSVPFSNSFTAGTTVTGGNSFGLAAWRMGGIECGVYGIGATDGGTNALIMDVVHEDAGIDCQCNLGSAACAGGAQFSCDCAGMVQLQGSRWQMQPDSTSTCQTMPSIVFCTADLFR